MTEKWESTVYTVVEENLEIHVYKIKNATGQCRVVHRHLLFDVNFLPVSDNHHNAHLDSSADSDTDSVGTEGPTGL